MLMLAASMHCSCWTVGGLQFQQTSTGIPKSRGIYSPHNFLQYTHRQSLQPKQSIIHDRPGWKATVPHTRPQPPEPHHRHASPCWISAFPWYTYQDSTPSGHWIVRPTPSPKQEPSMNLILTFMLPTGGAALVELGCGLFLQTCTSILKSDLRIKLSTLAPLPPGIHIYSHL